MVRSSIFSKSRVIVDDDNRVDDNGFVEGCWGTISTQADEAHLDKRHAVDYDDDDDAANKGRLEFPTDKLYGREGDLEMLGGLYEEIIEEERDRKKALTAGDKVPYAASARIVFIGGYRCVYTSPCLFYYKYLYSLCASP